jgi:hypothetical protein
MYLVDKSLIAGFLEFAMANIPLGLAIYESPHILILHGYFPRTFADAPHHTQIRHHRPSTQRKYVIRMSYKWNIKHCKQGKGRDMLTLFVQ